MRYVVSDKHKFKYKEKYIISDAHKFIYFVIQKGGCTSIKTTLLPLFDLDTTLYKAERRKSDTAHVSVHDLFDKSEYQINKKQFLARLGDQYQSYFKFAFVRNPWDRLVSCWREKLAKSKGHLMKVPSRPDIELYLGMPFAEFVEAVCEISDDEANPHFRSQYKTICALGKDKPILADFVGRFESLADHFEIVSERIGDAKKLQLPHFKRVSREGHSYTEFYDDRLKKLVYERYQEDIEVFDYSFGDSRILPPLWPQDTEAALASLETEMATENWLLQQRVEDLKQQLAHGRREARQLNKQLDRCSKNLQSLRGQLRKLQSSRTRKLLNKLNGIRSRVSAK